MFEPRRKIEKNERVLVSEVLKEMRLRLGISSSGRLGNDFSPGHHRCSSEVSARNMKELEVDTSHLFIQNI